MAEIQTIYSVVASRSKRWAEMGLPCAMRCGEAVEAGTKVEVRIKHGESSTRQRYSIYHWGCRPDAVDRQWNLVVRQLEAGTHFSQKISRS